MSLLSFFGFNKKEKPSLTQAFRELPSAEQAPLFGSLKDFARKRISGENLGFGDNFVDKAGGPMATRMRNDFKSYTAPRLSSQASSRGLGRSTLALDIDRRANQENESNIDQLYADLFKLNEMQKKTDEQFGVNVGQNLDTQYLNQANQAAEAFNTAERGNTERTAGVAATNNAASRQRQNQTIAGLLNTVSPGMGNTFMPQPVTANQNAVSAANPFMPSATKVNIAGSNNQAFEAWLNSMFPL